MPIYEYRCQQCKNLFEALVGSSRERDQTRCPQCDGDQVQRVISAGSFRISSAGSGSPPAGALSGCSSRSGFS
ncbi:MAG: FmdB family zinc ribbon protein [Desulfurivibrio sp.]